ncbi:MAG: hypothetical protein Ct9H300mP29_8030 [Candidatus Neomarinimicrobiota bacterium]|nr:MAG: hypothetical protein Ct9H300mP29_8030 [Candidatus Neomarinimicrobiota bacterium]
MILEEVMEELLEEHGYDIEFLKMFWKINRELL